MRERLFALALMFLILLKIVFGEGSTMRELNVPNNCTMVAGETTLVTFPGWPFQLDCSVINNVTTASQKCYVSSDGQPATPSNQSRRLNVTTTFTVSLVFNESSCQSKLVTVELRSISTRSTFDSIENDVANNISVVFVRKLLHDETIFHCVPPSNGDDGSTVKFAPPPDYNVTWWRTRRFENDTLSSITKPPRPFHRNYTQYIMSTSLYASFVSSRPSSLQSIRRRETNYFDPAVYSCEVQYKDERAFIIHESLCVEDRVNDQLPAVVCTNPPSFVEGDNVILSCDVHNSNTMIGPRELIIRWTKEGNSEPDCTYIYESDEASVRTDARYNCSFISEFPNRPSKCFMHLPRKEELDQHPKAKVFKIELEIRNTKKNDAGSFIVQVQNQGKVSEPKTVHLEFNREEELRRIVIILVVILAVLLVISIFVGLMWWNWIQIQLLIRRHMGNYDEDGKQFVAILSYVYSMELEPEVQERTKKIVKCIQEKMNDMDYKFYDSHRDFEQGSTIENLLKYLNESHRMIVILTDAYVEKRWTRFEAQQGFLNMLKNRTKLIFVNTPGAKKALSKCKKDGEDFASELSEAMKASRNIQWTEKTSDSRFKDNVQYALPNLERLRSTENSSSNTIALQAKPTHMSTIVWFAISGSFGIGARVYPGGRFALQEMSCLIIALLSRYRIECHHEPFETIFRVLGKPLQKSKKLHTFSSLKRCSASL